MSISPLKFSFGMKVNVPSPLSTSSPSSPPYVMSEIDSVSPSTSVVFANKSSALNVIPTSSSVDRTIGPDTIGASFTDSKLILMMLSSVNSPSLT